MTQDLRPFAANYLTNPPQSVLVDLARRHTPSIFRSDVGNLNKISRNKARQAKYTYIIGDESQAGDFSHQLIDRARAEEIIARQTAHIEAAGELIAIEGYLGVGPRAVPVQWLYTLNGANIAGMQQVLAFPPEDVLEPGAAFSAEFQVIYTPSLFLEDMPGRQAIIVDLENFRTHVIGPDYFGESKKAALRMLNEKVYQEGGLVLHAGAKLVEHAGGRLTMTVMGLSGTGKTTTTFSKQGEVTRPVQDDMVALWPGGELSITENGCFAKTFGLTEETEPTIYRGTLSEEAWVENVYQNADGAFDFFKSTLTPDEVATMEAVLVDTGAPAANVRRYIAGDVSEAELRDDNGVLQDGWEFVEWTANGRSIIPMSAIEDAADLHAIPDVHCMGILNRDEGTDAATPALVRFASPEQAAAYFMLGETSKTSAAGKERGKTRSPFTQPFFPRSHGLQARRFGELAATMPEVVLWMMNTGYVGGDAKSVKEGVGHKVKIRHSSACLEALLTNQVVWKTDPDFGYEIVDTDAPENAALLARVPADLLEPRKMYARTGRADEHQAWVHRMKGERRTFLENYGVDSAIVQAVTG